MKMKIIALVGLVSFAGCAQTVDTITLGGTFPLVPAKGIDGTLKAVLGVQEGIKNAHLKAICGGASQTIVKNDLVTTKGGEVCGTFTSPERKTANRIMTEGVLPDLTDLSAHDDDRPPQVFSKEGTATLFEKLTPEQREVLIQFFEDRNDAREAATK